jgi:predicted RNA binding protein YcfA (HicA-like mRNA interferase family)
MTRLPALNAKTLERILFNVGFERVRQKGSHAFYRYTDGRTTTMPHHAGRDLARPLLREILREVDLTPDELLDQLKNL